MILLDFSQVVIANYTQQFKQGDATEEGLLRHVCLNSVRMYNAMFRERYGKMVICTDSANSWRRDVFPYYKAARRRNREKSEIDWQHLFSVLRMVRQEIKENLPYQVIEVDGAEADDVIATIALHNQELSVIVSSDKDFRQLQTRPNIRQYSPHSRDFVICPDPAKFLKEQIMQGDSSDGVPNFLSGDDVFVTGTRQASVMKAKLAVWVTQEPEEFCDSRMLRNYRRNEQLVDLRRTPEHIQQAILEAYAQPPVVNNNSRVYSYLQRNRLSNLLESMADFAPGDSNMSIPAAAHTGAAVLQVELE